MRDETTADQFRFYDQGWNDFVDGKPWPAGERLPTIDYRDGWHDARDFELEHGKKPEHI